MTPTPEEQRDLNRQMIDAATMGWLEGVAGLLDKANPLATDWAGMSALMRAAHGAHTECVRLLLDLSDADAVDLNGDDALISAAQSGNAECVKILLPKSDPLRKNKVGATALMAVVHRAGIERGFWGERLHPAVAALLPASDAKAQDDWGMSALMIAAGMGVVSPELAAASDTNQQNDCGLTALMIAAEKGDAQGVAILLPLSDTEIREREGKTAADLAFMNNHTDVYGAICAWIERQEIEREVAAARSRGASEAGAGGDGQPERRIWPPRSSRAL